MHLGSQLFALEPYRRAIRALATLGEFGTYDLGGGLGVRYTARRPASSTSRPGSRGDGRGRARASSAPAVELVLEPGRALVANAGVTLYGVESVKAGVAGERLVAVDGGMSDNLRPMLYGASYEAHVVDAHGRGRRRQQRGRQALRVRRRARARRAAARSAPRRRARHPGDGRLRVRDRQQLQRPARDRRWCSAPAATPASWCAARPTRSCMAETSEPFRIGLLGHGTVGGAFEHAARASAPARSPRPPACGPSWSAC